MGGGKSNDMFSVRINNLDYHTNENDIRRKFEKFGEIGDIFLPTDRQSGRSRGFGFVRFYKKEHMEDCAHEYKRGLEIDGRDIRCEVAEKRPPVGAFNRDDRDRMSRGGGFGGGRRRSRSRSRDRGRRRSPSPRRRSRDRYR